MALAAALHVILEGGDVNLARRGVGLRPGVAKATIYRRWPERGSLISDTTRATFEHVHTPDTGSLRGDLDEYFSGMIQSDLTGKVGRLIPCLIDAAARDPEIEMLLERVTAERQQPLLTIVSRAQERGELPPDLDRDVVIGTVLGPLVFRKVLLRRPVDAAYVSKCLDVALAGLGARAVEPAT